jgi:hypothetical protein
MLTSGDIQFQPPTTKIYTFTTSINVMTSGDAGFQNEFLQHAYAEVRQLISANPKDWLAVEDVAQIIIKHRNEAKARRSEAAILAPLSLTRSTFLSGAHGLGDALSKTIASDLVQFQVPSTSTIVCGVDSTGAHIFTIYDGNLYCNDPLGFAAIGIGARHAESQFMLAEHARQNSLSETLLLVYAAKKRAEIAPGVGTVTDMFTGGPGLGSMVTIDETIVTRVDKAVRKILTKERSALSVGKMEMQQYVDALQPAPGAQEAGGGTFPDEPDGEGQPAA